VAPIGDFRRWLTSTQFDVDPSDGRFLNIGRSIVAAAVHRPRIPIWIRPAAPMVNAYAVHGLCTGDIGDTKPEFLAQDGSKHYSEQSSNTKAEACEEAAWWTPRCR